MRFSQGKNSKLRTFMGTGIGLALTKELVELHHGRIKVSSVVNEGTRFDVILPLGKDHFRTEEIVDDIPEEVNIESDSDIYLNDFVQENDGPSKIMETNSKTNKNLVLIIEDHPEVRQYIREHLMNEFQIIEAENGIQGLEIAQEYLPDLIISDVMMPEMDGFQFVDHVRQHEAWRTIPIVVVTAKDLTAADRLRLNGYVTEIIRKDPRDQEELLAEVSKMVRTRLQKGPVKSGNGSAWIR